MALDTEADSLHAYPEKLCLLQISLAGADELIDPLAKINLAPLWTELRKHELILHGADYDLRLLRKNENFVPTKIFDTMLAARLLGNKEVSLRNLLAKYLDVILEKGSQKADWARRPLTARMENYARNDTRFLKPLADILRSELEQKNRLAWHQETCARLVEECAEIPPLDAEAWRIKGSSQLGRLPLTILRELWRWREEEAIAANKPPYFILSHEVLVAISAAVGTGRAFPDLLPRYLSDRRKRNLQNAVARGLEIAVADQPPILSFVTRRPTQEENRRFEELKNRRDRAAAELQLDPALLASRAMLVLLAQDFSRYERSLMNWQRDLLKEN